MQPASPGRPQVSLGSHRWAGAGSVAGQACLSAQSPGPAALQSQTRSWACKHSLLCRLNEAGFVTPRTGFDT